MLAFALSVGVGWYATAGQCSVARRFIPKDIVGSAAELHMRVGVECLYADLDDTGRKDYVVAAYYSDPVNSEMKIIAMVGKPKVVATAFPHGRLAVQLMDLDGDHHPEIVVDGSFDHGSLTSAYRWTHGRLQKLITSRNGVFEDLDADGKLEFVEYTGPLRWPADAPRLLRPPRSGGCTTGLMKNQA